MMLWRTMKMATHSSGLQKMLGSLLQVVLGFGLKETVVVKVPMMELKTLAIWDIWMPTETTSNMNSNSKNGVMSTSGNVDLMKNVENKHVLHTGEEMNGTLIFGNGAIPVLNIGSVMKHGPMVINGHMLTVTMLTT